MRQANRGLEIQNDPEAEKNLVMTNLLITWAQLPMESSQEALSIILQDSGYSEMYSPIEQFFDYLERLDERISVSLRHRQAGKSPVKSKDMHHKDDEKKKETYGPRSLKWSAEKNV